MRFISDEGANYLSSNYSAFDLKYFRNLIKSGDNEMEFPKNGLVMKRSINYEVPCTVDWSRIMAITPFTN